MKKKLMLLALVAAVALVTAGPALAAGGGHGNIHRHELIKRSGPRALPGQQYFALVGIITGLNPGTVTVEVHNGNRFVKEYIGGELTVEVGEDTEYRRWTPTGCIPIEPDEVEVDDTTSIHGTVIEGVFRADRVTVDVPLDCCTP